MNIFRDCRAPIQIAQLTQLQVLSESVDSEAPTGAAKLRVSAMMSDWNILDNTELPQIKSSDCVHRCTSPAFWSDLCCADAGVNKNLALNLTFSLTQNYGDSAHQTANGWNFTKDAFY